MLKITHRKKWSGLAIFKIFKIAALVDREGKCVFVASLHSKDCNFDGLPYRFEYDEDKVEGFYFEFKSETKRLPSKMREEIFKKEFCFYTGEKKVDDENLQLHIHV